jgi:hypothetical protein
MERYKARIYKGMGAPNNSFNRSGDCVAFMLPCPSKVEWIHAAGLIRALDVFAVVQDEGISGS